MPSSAPPAGSGSLPAAIGATPSSPSSSTPSAAVAEASPSSSSSSPSSSSEADPESSSAAAPASPRFRRSMSINLPAIVSIGGNTCAGTSNRTLAGSLPRRSKFPNVDASFGSSAASDLAPNTCSYALLRVRVLLPTSGTSCSCKGWGQVKRASVGGRVVRRLGKAWLIERMPRAWRWLYGRLLSDNVPWEGSKSAKPPNCWIYALIESPGRLKRGLTLHGRMGLTKGIKN